MTLSCEVNFFLGGGLSEVGAREGGVVQVVLGQHDYNVIQNRL
jgi:hypothetical protein